MNTNKELTKEMVTEKGKVLILQQKNEFDMEDQNGTCILDAII